MQHENLEPSRFFGDWSYRDSVALIIVLGILCPPLGLAVLLGLVVVELAKVIGRTVTALSEWVSAFGSGLSRMRRELVWDIEDWFAEEPPKPAGPPGKEELLARILARYEEKLALLDKAKLDEFELAAARERVKQQYLRDLEEVMK